MFLYNSHNIFIFITYSLSFIFMFKSYHINTWSFLSLNCNSHQSLLHTYIFIIILSLPYLHIYFLYLFTKHFTDFSHCLGLLWEFTCARQDIDDLSLQTPTFPSPGLCHSLSVRYSTKFRLCLILRDFRTFCGQFPLYSTCFSCK